MWYANLERDLEMLEELKKTVMRKVLKRVAICSVIVILILIVVGSSLVKLCQGPKKLSSVPAAEMPGTYVEGDITAIIDKFADFVVDNDNGNEAISNMYYIIPVGDKQYCAINVPKDNTVIANQICNETYDYLMGNRDNLTTTMHIKGTFNKMNDEVYGYYSDWFQKSGFVEDASSKNFEKIALPYILEVDRVGNHYPAELYLAIGAASLILLYAAVIFIKGNTGAYLSQIKSHISQNGSSIEFDYHSSVSIESVKVGKNFTLYFKKFKPIMVNNKDILWAYLRRVSQSVNHIDTGVAKVLVLNTTDKKNHSILMKKEESVSAVLALYLKNNPHIILGFNYELQQCYKYDIDAFIALSRKKEADAHP